MSQITNQKKFYINTCIINIEINDRLKETNIKNCTCSYLHDIIKFEDFDLDYILLEEKSYKNILVYNISYKTLIDSKPLRIRFDKIDGFIKIYDETTTTFVIF